MEIGAAVEHRVYGKGIVKAFRHAGFECRVEFDLQIQLWLPASKLHEIEPQKSAVPTAKDPVGCHENKNDGSHIAPVSVQPSAADISEILKQDPVEYPTVSSAIDHCTFVRPSAVAIPCGSKFVARKMVESMRMGVVSENHASRFTLGRESVMEDLCKRLCDPNGLPIVLSGEYGSGKTHLLDYLYGVIGGLHGFAVARCSLDVNEIGLHQPKNVYREFVRNFRFTERDSGRVLDFASFLKLREVRRIFLDHHYFGCIESDHIDAEVLHWITGREESTRPWLPVGRGFQHLPPLYPYQNAANIYTNLLTGLSYACKMVGGRGLILLFDEAEFLNGPFTAYQLERGRNFLDALVRCVKDDKKLTDKPISTGLDYSRKAGETPFLFRKGADLRALFAFADPAIADISSELKSAHRIKLEPLNTNSYDSALVQINALYNEAYGTEFSADDGNIQKRWAQLRGQTTSPRLFFKGCVEVFDLARANLQGGGAL